MTSARPEASDRLRLLYLGFAFPPGVTTRFPSLSPAGHATETRMMHALNEHVDAETVTVLPPELLGQLEPRDDSLGLEPDLVLWDREPEVWHRWRSWRELRRFYLERVERHGPPDVVFARNLTPVYNRFILWLRSQQRRPVLVLVLADSSSLGHPLPPLRRLRYRLKPMKYLDDDAVHWFDACISFSNATEKYFTPQGIQWLWMPSAYNFKYDPPAPDPAETGPIRFGYFGALAEHAAVVEAVQAFLKADLPGTLHMAGYGKLTKTLQELSEQHPKFRFDGLQPSQVSCLTWAQQVDVLINPRLAIWGNENNFPSKIFEYAMTGKAILTTRTGGVDAALGPEAFYCDDHDLESGLAEQLREISQIPRPELQRRGAVLRNRVLAEYSWSAQAQRMAEFLNRLCDRTRL